MGFTPVHHFITGIAGFIGSHLAERLIADGHRVSGVDDFSLGRTENLGAVHGHGLFHVAHCDVSDTERATAALKHVAEWGGVPDMVWHLAANSDIAAGVADTSIDFRKTLQTTQGTLQAVRAVGVKRIAFASTSAVYGGRSDLLDRKSTRLNSSHIPLSRMPSSA